jgi:hypothetical protein
LNVHARDQEDSANDQTAVTAFNHATTLAEESKTGPELVVETFEDFELRT